MGCLQWSRWIELITQRSGVQIPSRNHLNLDQEVAGIWRPLAVSGGSQHSRQIALQRNFQLVVSQWWNGRSAIDFACAPVPVADRRLGGLASITSRPTLLRSCAKLGSPPPAAFRRWRAPTPRRAGPPSRSIAARAGCDPRDAGHHSALAPRAGGTQVDVLRHAGPPCGRAGTPPSARHSDGDGEPDVGLRAHSGRVEEPGPPSSTSRPRMTANIASAGPRSATNTRNLRRVGSRSDNRSVG